MIDHENLYTINRNLFYAIHYSLDDDGYWWEAFDQDGKDVATSHDVHPTLHLAKIDACIALDHRQE